MSESSASPGLVRPPIFELDAALVTRALSGDAVAVDALVRRLMPVLFARVHRARGKGALKGRDAEDLVQDIWLVLVANEGRQLAAYDPTRGMTLEGYVGLVAEREIGNHRDRTSAKKRGGHLRAVDPDALARLPSAMPSPEESVTTADLAVRLGTHLQDELPARGKLVFRYAFTDGRPAGEVAQIMGVNVQVIYNWQHRIRDVARAFLNG